MMFFKTQKKTKKTKTKNFPMMSMTQPQVQQITPSGVLNP